ncbi:hypothetical protein DH86_00004169 [Scytalidium sp. 3C]|nr:hypothetical protein DH86_00004169 [Scytalidium sp. 3C]
MRPEFKDPFHSAIIIRFESIFVISYPVKNFNRLFYHFGHFIRQLQPIRPDHHLHTAAFMHRRLYGWGTDIYNNLIYSQSGFDLEYATCFPPQFYRSVLASISSTSLGPFTALVCPHTWENYDINSTYVICCPSLLAPNVDDPIRPGAGAVCTTYLGPSELLDITSFDSTGRQTVVGATAGPDGTVVFANAFDGITATGVSLPPAPSSTPVSTTASSSTSSSSLLPSSLKITSSSAASTSSSTKTAIPLLAPSYRANLFYPLVASFILITW